MKELELRRWHRGIGILLATFLAAQTVSGLWLTARSLIQAHGETTGAHSADEAHGSLFAGVHHGGGRVGSIYRLAVGAGTLWMAGTGTLIFIRGIARKSQGKRRR